MRFGRRPSWRERICDEHDKLAASLFGDAFCGVAAIHPDGRILRCNAQLRALAGSAELVRPGSMIEALFGPEGRETVMAALLRVCGGGAAEILLAPVAQSTVRMSLHGLADGEGPPEIVMLRTMDITPRLLLEKQIAVSQRMQEVGQLTGGVAHDFNNLLTALIGAADAILLRPGIDRDTHDDARQILASAGRGADLVHQLQAFGRQQTLQPRALPVNPAISALADLLRRLLGGSIRLQLELERPGRAVHIDPVQLDRALMNLAMNARQAMEQGGVMTLRSQHETLLRRLDGVPDSVPPGRYVVIDVEDTGGGISGDLIERIFEPFFTTRRESGGNGLGLATVHGIVRQSGGYLTVDSVVGAGTRMRLHLPRWDGPAAAAHLSVAPVAAAPRFPAPSLLPAPCRLSAPRVVLLVEDEAPVLRLASRALSRDGWTVLTAVDGEAAMMLMAEQQPPIAVVVTDMMMPGMDGAMLLGRLRQLPGLARLPAILVSGYAEAGLRDAAAAAATLFLPKPYGMKALAARLDEVVAGGAANEAEDVARPSGRPEIPARLRSAKIPAGG